jgi:sec-independent protein translocase protein TatA
MTRPDLVPAMFGLSGWELIIILMVALLLFGRRLPDIMRGMGSSVREFKKGMEETTSAVTPPSLPPPPAPAPPAGAVARDAATPPAVDPQHPPKA